MYINFLLSMCRAQPLSKTQVSNILDNISASYVLLLEHIKLYEIIQAFIQILYDTVISISKRDSKLIYNWVSLLTNGSFDMYNTPHPHINLKCCRFFRRIIVLPSIIYWYMIQPTCLESQMIEHAGKHSEIRFISPSFKMKNHIGLSFNFTWNPNTHRGSLMSSHLILDLYKTSLRISHFHEPWRVKMKNSWRVS